MGGGGKSKYKKPLVSIFTNKCILFKTLIKSFFINPHSCILKSSNAFTLAEVLVTLGVIGVVAAMTLPTLVQNYQKMVLKNQFKKAYATFYNGIKAAQGNLGYPVGCFYWTGGQICKEVCINREPTYNSCTAWECEDGSPLPANQNGLRTDCAAFEEELFTNVLKVVKFCDKNALSKGCLTEKYKGTDKVQEQQNPDAEYPPNPASNFSDTNIKNKQSSWVLADGTVIIKYGTYKSPNFPIFAVDINGHKGPNKWGYDLFGFQIMGNSINGITKLNGYNTVVETGGITSSKMIQEMFK